MSKVHRVTIGLSLLLAVAVPLSAQSIGSAEGGRAMPAGAVFNIVDWEGGPLPPLYERSAQLPLSLDGVVELHEAEFSDDAIIKTLEERRCSCDASVASMVHLERGRVSEQVIQAMSLHALAPNRRLDLVIHMDFEGLGKNATPSAAARKGYLYLIIPDGERDRVFFGNLGQALGRAGRTQVDNTDLLLPKAVRRASFVARVPLKEHGRKSALVFTSTRPDIYTVTDIPEADRKAAQEFTFDYPASSLQSRCTLQALHRQDVMLADRWHLERSHLECEWD